MSKQSGSLDDVLIRVSIGIGRNFIEAEEAMRAAKARKGEDRYYNIVQYTGPSIDCQKGSISKAAESYLQLEERFRQLEDSDGLECLSVLKYDAKTGLLNRMGYEVETEKLREDGRYEGRVIILIDGDNMKKANTEAGYNTTDRYLVAIGRALLRNTRHTRDDDKNARNTDILLNRVNDSGGDEFIVDIGCDYAHAESVARRCVDAVYRAQRRIKR